MVRHLLTYELILAVLYKFKGLSKQRVKWLVETHPFHIVILGGKLHSHISHPFHVITFINGLVKQVEVFGDPSTILEHT